MKLADLECYNPITIQCHDNPDADAIASGYGLYCYYKSKGKDVRLVYSGMNQIQKSNLRLMVEKLHLPIEYVPLGRGESMHVDGLLITVDCQHGAGNVARLTADTVAVIDHHQQEIESTDLCLINSNLGCCATLVWNLLTEAGFVVDDATGLGTALYYGLYTDTNQFSEISNPWDKDMRDALPYDNSMITLFRNSNISLGELEIAGIAMIRYSYNEDYEFAVIKTKPCDSNILGLISDFLLQVDVVKSSVVFNETGDGYKFSVRSCTKEVNASELAAFIADDMGSGGGHYEKAGGFISLRRYEEKYPTLHAEGYFNSRMVEYFDGFELIYADEYEVDISQMRRYGKKRVVTSYVKAADILPVGTPVTIRTLEGDMDMTVEEDLYIVIGVKGDVHPDWRKEFLCSYEVLEDEDYMEKADMEYEPVIKNRIDGQDMVLTDLAKKCIPSGDIYIYAKPLTKGVKVFTAWDKNRYMLGRPGDYLAVRESNPHDIFVVERDLFDRTYEITC